jgi:hypothetical protein
MSTYYPYLSPNTTGASSTPTPAQGSGGGLPKWVGPVLGVILGLIFLTGLVLCWLLWRRRYVQPDKSLTATSDNRKRIMGWMYGVPKHSDNATRTSTEIGISDKDAAVFDVVNADMKVPHSPTAGGQPDLRAVEAHSSPVHEMQGVYHSQAAT